MNFTIVQHRDGWCIATEAERNDSVPTLCKGFVILPWAVKSGRPTCPECIAILRGGKEKA